MQLDFQSFDVFAESDNAPDISEKVGENFGFVEVTISKTLNLDVCDIGHSSFLDIISKFLKFGATAEKVGMAYVQFIDLSGVENHLNLRYWDEVIEKMLCLIY